MKQRFWKVNKTMMDSINKILIGMEESVGRTEGQEVLFLADGSFAIRGMCNIVPI
jgi:hypothetical protein